MVAETSVRSPVLTNSSSIPVSFPSRLARRLYRKLVANKNSSFTDGPSASILAAPLQQVVRFLGP